MKKLFFILIGSVIIAITFFYIKTIIKTDYLQLKDKTNVIKLVYKGLESSRDFTYDNDGNLYIAFKSEIEAIDVQGNCSIILENKELKIDSIDCSLGILYFTSGKGVYSYNIAKKELNLIIDNLPNYGDYSKSIIKVNGNNLYVTIGAATNSGVVGSDNNWAKENSLLCDLSPFPITLSKLYFGNNKTGAFAPIGSMNKTDNLKGNFPGNSSIIIYNLGIGLSETYAWGIRNVEGLDFNSKGEIIAVVGGMEDRGERPIKGDSDYIYKINKGLWYGFPDFTGGDPVTSPRFSLEENNSTKMLLSIEPTPNPPAPIYVFKELGALASLAVDKTGVISNKNTSFFYDRKGNIVYSLGDRQIIKQEIVFSDLNYISSIKFYKNSLYLLDSKTGYLETLSKK